MIQNRYGQNFSVIFQIKSSRQVWFKYFCALLRIFQVKSVLHIFMYTIIHDKIALPHQLSLLNSYSFLFRFFEFLFIRFPEIHYVRRGHVFISHIRIVEYCRTSTKMEQAACRVIPFLAPCTQQEKVTLYSHLLFLDNKLLMVVCALLSVGVI